MDIAVTQARLLSLKAPLAEKLGIKGDHLNRFLANLAASLAYSSSPLVLDSLAWLIQYGLSRGVSRKSLEEGLGILERAIVPLLRSKEVFENARGFLAQASLEDLSRACGPGLMPEAERYLKLILAHEGTQARELILQLARSGWKVRRIYRNVLQPVLLEIGDLWLRNQLGVADEHYATAVTQTVMVDLHPYLLKGLRRIVESRGRALFFSVGDELHDFGVRMVADFLEFDGWDTYYLGANLPLDAFLEAVASYDPELVAISVTLPEHLLELGEMIRALRTGTHREVRILVGGFPFSVDPELTRQFEVDGSAPDAIRAVRIARRLFRKSQRRGGRGPVVAPVGPKPLERATAPRERPADPMEEITRLSCERIVLHRQLSKRNAIAERLNEEKNRFLGMAAHDLRNPVHTILQCTDFLARSGAPALGEKELRLLRLISMAASSMAEILDHFLDISMIEAGKLELRREPTDLVSLVEKRVELLQLIAERVGVRVNLEKAQAPMILEIDPARVGQVVENLLSNAIKFSPKGAKVEVKVSQRDSTAVVSVRDEGPGIEPEQQRELFHPFHRLPSAIRQKKPGTGLGLHIAKRVIQEHGGRIWVESQPGGGCTFFFSLPTAQARPRAAA